MKRIVLALAMLMPLVGICEPAPFGLELGKATIKEVRAKYSTKNAGINKYSKGEMYELDVSQINFDGLQSATAIFSQEGKLVAVLTTLPNEKFDYVLNGLASKYKLVSKQIPFVGNKSAKFVDGNTEISLTAPHMSFEMEMNYINKDLWKAYKSQSDADAQQKQSREKSQL